MDETKSVLVNGFVDENHTNKSADDDFTDHVSMDECENINKSIDDSLPGDQFAEQSNDAFQTLQAQPNQTEEEEVEEVADQADQVTQVNGQAVEFTCLKENFSVKQGQEEDEASKSQTNDRPVVHLPADPIARASFARPEGTKLKELLKKAVKSAGDYNRQINQERRDERRFSLDLQTYTFHYPVGLGLDNRTLQHNVENGRCRQIGKYPVAMLPGHFQDWYRGYSANELKYLPINTVLYGPVISDPDLLPPVLSRFEEDSYSDSDAESVISSDQSCCCDESRCKKLKLDWNETNGNVSKCDCGVNGESSASSSESSSEEDGNESNEDDKPPPLPILVKAFDSNGVCC